MNIGHAVNLDCAGRKIEHERRALLASELAVEHAGPHLHGKSGLNFEEADARDPDLSPLLRKNGRYFLRADFRMIELDEGARVEEVPSHLVIPALADHILREVPGNHRQDGA